jgi:heat-inducible transcriptional repressor
VIDRPLTERQERILRYVVEAFIADGQPVGSKTLVARGVVDAAPSTVRAELAALEDRGMLDHPHTSAGRVPTDTGYRRYVETLLRAPLAATRLPVDFSLAHRELDTALGATADALARMTNLLAVVSAPSLGTTVIRHVELLRLQPTVVMAVVITSTGGVAKRLFVFDQSVDTGLVDWATEYLEEMVVGQSPGALILRRRFADPGHGQAERAFLETIAPLFIDLAGEGDGSIHLGGTASLLAELQARDVEAVRDVVRALEDRLELLAMLREAVDADRLSVRVGDELVAPALRSLALVSAPYGVGNRSLGTVTVVGPTRMDYGVAIRSVRGAAAALSEFVEEIYG